VILTFKVLLFNQSNNPHLTKRFTIGGLYFIISEMENMLMKFINTIIVVLFLMVSSSCNHSQTQNTALCEKEKSDNSVKKPIDSVKTSSEKPEKAKT
jgi:hypothetical protein